MTLAEFKNILRQAPDKGMTFILPDQTPIPAEFHITEIGHVRKEFIDCGGTRRSSSACLLQAWVAENDEEHLLTAGKLRDILQRAEPLLPTEDLPVEVEFETSMVSQYAVAAGDVAGPTIVLYLQGRHTDCLARDKCGLGAPSTSAACGCG